MEMSSPFLALILLDPGGEWLRYGERSVDFSKNQFATIGGGEWERSSLYVMMLVFCRIPGLAGKTDFPAHLSMPMPAERLVYSGMYSQQWSQ